MKVSVIIVLVAIASSAVLAAPGRKKGFKLFGGNRNRRQPQEKPAEGNYA
jgi:hypothetical protein